MYCHKSEEETGKFQHENQSNVYKFWLNR